MITHITGLYDLCKRKFIPGHIVKAFTPIYFQKNYLRHIH